MMNNESNLLFFTNQEFSVKILAELWWKVNFNKSNDLTYLTYCDLFPKSYHLEQMAGRKYPRTPFQWGYKICHFAIKLSSCGHRCHEILNFVQKSSKGVKGLMLYFINCPQFYKFNMPSGRIIKSHGFISFISTTWHVKIYINKA